jgi:hypothetical protein
MLSAYVLIQTEVGKVAHVSQALSDLDGVQVAEDLAGPTTSSPGFRRRVWISWAGWWSSGSSGGRRHPHPDLHGDPSVTA